MSIVFSLVLAFMRERRTRVMLTVLATAASTCLVVWVASGYDSLLTTFDVYAHKALGRYQLSVAPIQSSQPEVSGDLLEALRADPSVDAAIAMWAEPVEIHPVGASDQGEVEPTPHGTGDGLSRGRRDRRRRSTLVAVESADPPFELASGRWLAGNDDAQPAVVLTVAAADRMGVAVGDVVRVGAAGAGVECEVVGVVQAPSLVGGASLVSPILVPACADVFALPTLARRILEKAPVTSFIGVAVKTDADINRFRFGWAPRLNRFSPPVQFQEAHDIEERLDETAAAENVALQSYAATGVAFLVALLVVFSSLNAGVTERIRQFAVLRAVCLTRTQVAALLAVEGFVLATIGCVAGVAIGEGLLRLTGSMSSKVLHHGAGVGPRALALAAVAAFGGGLLAAIVPGYRATRVRPVDAMGSRTSPEPGSVLSLRGTLVGVLLLGVGPVLTFIAPPPFESGVVAVMVATFVALAAGIVLVTPAVVVAVDRFMGPPLARAFGIEGGLFANQIAGHLWRSVGAALSLSVGLGLFIGIHVWGATMLHAYIPGAWAPDAVINFRGGLPPERSDSIGALPGVDPSRALPVVVEQPRLLDDLTRSQERASVTRQDNVIIAGIDAPRAMQGPHPLLNFTWVAGSPDEASVAINEGRGCVVPDHFLRETGLKIGDTITLVPPESPERPVTYSIAGAVRLLGWHWFTKQTGFRPRTHRAAALIFADYQNVADDFGLPRSTHAIVRYAGPAVDDQALAAAARRLPVHVTDGDTADGRNGPRVITVEGIRKATRQAAGRWIWLISQVPIVALLISCIGVLNVLLASVHARRWEFGVVRAIGFTRSAIVRAVLAEAILLGMVAVVVSLVFGIIAGWCGCGLAQYISFFGGLHPSLVVPVSPIVTGVIVLLLLMPLSAAWPAIDVGRRSPLSLLQQGRDH